MQGVVLTASFPLNRVTRAPTDIAEREKEVLVIGPVTGASVKTVLPDR